MKKRSNGFRSSKFKLLFGVSLATVFLFTGCSLGQSQQSKPSGISKQSSTAQSPTTDEVGNLPTCQIMRSKDVLDNGRSMRFLPNGECKDLQRCSIATMDFCPGTEIPGPEITWECDCNPISLSWSCGKKDQTKNTCPDSENKISNFEECKAAGYEFSRTKPPRSCTAPDGKVFIEEIVPDKNPPTGENPSTGVEDGPVSLGVPPPPNATFEPVVLGGPSTIFAGEGEVCGGKIFCSTGRCIFLNNTKAASTCFTGDPCSLCDSGKCRITESYPGKRFASENWN